MAAAYAALVSLFNNLEDIQNHPRHSFSFDNKQIQCLLESVSFLIEFMESYDNSHGASREAAEALERRIASAAHAAEDVIESHVVDQILAGSTLRGRTRSRFLLDLQKVIEDMDYVRRKAIKVKAQSELKLKQPTYSAAATSSTPLTFEKSSMVGFDDVLLQLLDFLTGELSSRRVIPIVGMGGIGKTTLARNAFEHSLIVQHFDVCLWATISQQYVVEDILRELLSCLKKSTGGTVDRLGEGLYKSLNGQRYLIILDDMWSVEVWNEIRFFFPDNSNGSRIIVTSRQAEVAHHFSSSCLPMRFLDQDKSWDLFCLKAFAEQGCPPQLEDVGKKIVRKCKGLPLAIVVVGSHLGKSSRMQEYWDNVANHMSSILNSGENEHLFNILSLSYSHLPVHLKPCFLYMGTFLEDQDIYLRDLIKLWIAEGFLKPNKVQSLEKIAEGYLNDLIERNLILGDRRKLIDGKIGICKFHDVLRELCLKIAKEEKFFCLLHPPRAIHSEERRVVINKRISEEMHGSKIVNAMRSTPLVRSLTWEEGLLPFDLKLLRIMNKGSGCLAIDVDGGLLDSNFELVNLRYLNWRNGYPSYLDYRGAQHLCLSSSISQFWNLQTLIIITFCVVIAPHEIWEMIHLRHIDVFSVCLPDPLPDALVLRDLHTLSTAENLRLSEEVCRRIPNIKEFGVKYSYFGMECDEPMSHYCPYNLGCFQELESLYCDFDRNSSWGDFALLLTFPSSLEKLSLMNSHLDWEELTMMVGSLPNLETLELYENSVIGSEWSLVEGKFRRLSTLVIQNCDDLINWKAESFHFPVLKRLSLGYFSKLDEIPSGIGEIPTLVYISLVRCNVDLSVSAMRILVEQEENGNEGLRLEVFFWDDREKLESFHKMVQEEGLESNNLYLFHH